jgi:AcrR family transcriptional regulator
MSPRPYKLGKRQAAAAETRHRIVTASRELLATADDPEAFTIDAVARTANVSRMTVYYQFTSRAGLLEALFDDLAARARIAVGLAAAFQAPNGLAALDALIAAFARFWTADRIVMRRLHGMAALDPEVARGKQARDERRRQALQALLGRLQAESGRPAASAFADAVAVLHMLTSFEAFDALAGPGQTPEAVAPIVQRLARAALGLETP